jgi:hypothetical protein
MSSQEPTTQDQATPASYEHSAVYCFPLRGCCACYRWARLSDWNATPPEISDSCFACEHQACSKCKTVWSSLGQVKLATRRVAQYHEEQWKRKKARKEVSKEIAEIIKKHSKCYDVD